MNLWYGAKTWKAGEALSPLKLNRYVSDNYQYLRYRNRVQGSNNTNIALPLATPTALDDATLKLTFYVQENEDILLNVRFAYQAAVIGNNAWLDIFIDDSYYLSSGVATPTTRGLCRFSPEIINQVFTGHYRRRITGLEKGSHTFSLHMARSAAVTVAGATYPTSFEIESY